MGLVILTPPPVTDAGMVVTLAEAKEHLRVETDTSDALIARLIRTVTDWLAGRHGWLGRSLVKQTLALTVPLPLVPAFTGPAVAGVTGIVLPRPPVIQVQTVELLDAARLATAIDPLGFYTFEGDDGLTRLAFQADYRWPLITAGPAFIRVTYAAGYGEKGEDVDEGLRHAILMTVARLHESRGDAMLANLQDDPQIARMFAPYRVWTRG
jgi:uncharacterized phiE125 gp8 family phage protein